MASTDGQMRFYVPINLNVSASTQYRANFPPYFKEQPISTIKIANLTGYANLPNILDDHDEFYCIQLTSETLGAPSEYKNSTLLQTIKNTDEDGMKRLKGLAKKKVFSYYAKYNLITFNLPIEGREKYAGEHILFIKLLDLDLEEQNYNITVVIDQV